MTLTEQQQGDFFSEKIKEDLLPNPNQTLISDAILKAAKNSAVGVALLRYKKVLVLAYERDY